MAYATLLDLHVAARESTSTTPGENGTYCVAGSVELVCCFLVSFFKGFLSRVTFCGLVGFGSA